MGVAPMEESKPAQVPNGWDHRPIGEIADLQVGYAFKSAWFRELDGIPLLRGENVGYGSPDWEHTRRLSSDLVKNYREYVLEAGDIVIGMDRTFTKSGTKISVLRDADCPCLLVQRVGKFIPKNCDKNFLRVLLSYDGYLKGLRNEEKGMDIPHLSRSEILTPSVPIPPLAEQRAIAEALSDVDALIIAFDALITKKRHIKQGTMQQLLTGKKRLPGFTGEWEETTLGAISNIKTGSRNNEDKVEDGSYPFFVRSDVVERINTYSHECEAILIPGEGRIGSIFHYINGRFDVHQRVYAITQFSSCVAGRFIHYYMTKYFGEWAMRNTVKATVDSLRLPTFTTFAIKLPPTLAEQTAIAEVLSDMDAEITALEQKRDKTKLIKQGMMQELLTGKTRLVKN